MMSTAYSARALLAAALAFAFAVAARADHGDPSSRPNPVQPAYAPEAPSAVGTLKQDALELSLSMLPSSPQVGELARFSLVVHDPEQKREFQGDVKVVVTDEAGNELAAGPARAEDGECTFLHLVSGAGKHRVGFEFNADIPAWAPARALRPPASQPPLATGSDGKGKVWIEFGIEAPPAPLPLPLLIGGGVALLIVAMLFLRRRK